MKFESGLERFVRLKSPVARKVYGNLPIELQQVLLLQR